MEDEEEQSNRQIKQKKSNKLYWIIPIVILAGVGIFLYLNANDIQVDPLVDQFNNNRSFEQNVCITIKAIPSWVTSQGVIDEGYKTFEKLTTAEAVDLLINAKTYMVYHENCEWCKTQIAYFGSEWGRYVNSGYTIDCKYVQI